MAGLLAFIAAHGDANGRRAAIVDAVRTLAHRGGPDPNVLVVSGGAAVIAGEPVSYPASGPDAGRFVVAFDGELGNADAVRAELVGEHGAIFATGSDAEVVAAAYHWRGPRALADLRGGYAFVIWDTRSQRAFGARDQWGIRPLYHLARPEGLYLASEKKALLPFATAPADAAAGADADVSLDLASIAHYLTLQYVPEPATLHHAIGRVCAGESFAQSRGGPLANRRFVGLSFAPTEPADPQQLYDRILATLRASVHAATRADSPVGAYLSGGVDSAAIVALAREVTPELPTFTVGYDVDGFSEVDQAQATAAALGVPLTAVEVRAADVMAALPTVVWHLDDPIADPAVVAYYLLAQRARQQVGVVLTGDGADELFGGYSLYREPLSLAAVSGLPDQMQRGLRAVARALPQGLRGRSFLERATTPVEERYSGNARVFTEEECAALMRVARPLARSSDVTASVYAEGGRLDDVTRMQLVDLYTRLRGDVLVKADRLGMAHGLAMRAPFLDPDVFAVAATIPTELRVPQRTPETKVALRRAVAGLVPDEVANRRRQGVSTPLAAWLRGELGEWAHDTLSDSSVGDLIDLDIVRGYLDAHRRGEADHARKVWTVVVFCVWHAVFVTGALAPASNHG